MKRWGALLFFLFSLMVTTKWLIEYRAYEKNEITQEKSLEWSGHIKKADQPGPIPLQKISKEDQKYLPSPPKNQRGPSSLTAPKSASVRSKKLVGRKDALEQELMLINDPRSDWQEIFVERMLNTQAPETKLFVQHKGQTLIVKGTQARAVEEVLVTFKKDDKSVSSYMAWVDSETGSLVRTWSQTHNHNFRKKASGLTPTGAL